MSTRSLEQSRSTPHPTPRANTRLEERLLLGRLRHHLLRRASGRVLEIACGRGVNFLHFPEECRIIAGDINAGKVSMARATGSELGRNIDYQLMDAENLPFAEGSFDTVLSSMALCSYANPTRALHEMARVCEPDGFILLLEHGRSSFWPWARWQDLKESIRGPHPGCHDNREPLHLVEDAGLEVISASRTWFGVIHSIEARPPTR